ncbi:DUF726-domain-containing protein [Sodiomyces alkalinus F11]|uniref:DUF726-domain-containing protein n=1 Tax=Sodiomyces alkalinus (strain CBS 110278 / VKM F-3762 / F11) TaxID=1314773 RepID=A0A3N2Q9H2_SODAK|nr:DUF726-domain-containing protein [Sodiomyces alkalinus F11]ROT43414.1 DUF726-domain-containing protein [Sodiomyces alkalinus F11]
MPGGRGGRRTFPPRRGKPDLTGILAPEEKNALVALIIEATNKIEQQLEKAFEPTHPPLSSNDSSMPDKENQPPAHVSTHNSATPRGQPNSPMTCKRVHPSAPRKDLEATLSGHSETIRTKLPPQHVELKKELFAMFKRWENNLLGRFRDISVREARTMTTSSLRGGRGGGPGAARIRRGNLGDREAMLGMATRHLVNGGTSGGVSTPANYCPGQSSRPLPNTLDPYLARRFPPLSTWLNTLPLEKRRLLLRATILLVLSLESYSGFARVLMLYVTSSLGLPLRDLHDDEVRLARGLASAADRVDLDAVLQQKTSESKKSRKWKAAGAALISTAGSLAEPLAAAGIGCIMGGIRLSAPATAGLLGTVAHNGIVVGNMFGIYAGREAGKMIDQYGKDSADFAFLPVRNDGTECYRDARAVPSANRRMRVVVGIGGWLTKEDASVIPFQCFGSQAESFALRYEVENLTTLGTSLELVIKSAAWGIARKEMSKRSALSNLKERMWPLDLVRISKVIDNPWTVAMVRCEKAGMALAECIGRKVQGDRPVSLVGYSLGARAIYICLMALAERRQFGLVESVVMIGAPIPSDGRIWQVMRSVVTGRLVNVYSESDYVLGFLSRTSNLEFGVSGLQAIIGVEGIENCNVTRTVSGHLRYQYMIGTILKGIGWEDLDLAQIARDEETLAKKDKKFSKPKEQKPAHLPMQPSTTVKQISVENVSKPDSRMNKMKIQG